MKNTDKKVKQWIPFSMDKRLQPMYTKALLTAFYYRSKDSQKAQNYTKFSNGTKSVFVGDIERNISMSRIYDSLGAKSNQQKKAVRAAFAVFYARLSRGSNLSSSNSKWKNRADLEISKTAWGILVELKSRNKDVLELLNNQNYAKQEDYVVSVLEINSAIDDAAYSHVMSEMLDFFLTKGLSIDEQE